MISSIEDRLLKEVLSDTPEDDRETLINVCREYYIPNKMYFVDFVVFISALTKMGRLDIHDLDTDDIIVYEGTNVCVYGNFSSCDFCKDGRIIKLVLHTEITDDEDEGDLEFDVPAIVGRLENLKDLQVDGCRSFSSAWELSKLPQLETLHISACSLELDNNFPILQHLKKLQVDSFHFESTSDPFFLWMTSQLLPSVEEIKFYGDLDGESTDAILDFLSSIEDTSFKDNLKVLSMVDCGLNDNDFKTIMSKIRPEFNNLVELDLSCNNIQTVQHALNEIKNIKSLNVLNLNGNPILRKMEKDPEEKKVMLSFLKINNTVHNIGGLYYDPEIEYTLMINAAGLSIIEGSASGSGGRSLPLSMWPTVLERAYENSYHIYDGSWLGYTNCFKSHFRRADGVYDLLRNGLFGSLNYGGGNGNSNGGGSDNSKRKRK